MVTAAILPPTIWPQPAPVGQVNEALFSDFDKSHLHAALPLVMRRDYYESGETTGTHQHLDFLGLYVVRNGRAVHWIDDHPYGLVRGDVYLMAPGSMHRFCQFSELEIDVFFFQNTLFNSEELAALRECSGIWRLFAGDIQMEHRIHLKPEAWRQLETQIEVMRNQWGHTNRAGGLRLKHRFFSLLIDLADLLEKSALGVLPLKEEKPTRSGLAEALRFCEEHFDKPLSVPKLAARAFLSPAHFSQLFTREVGMPPASYIRHLRLDRARSLLRDTKIPIAEIAV